MTEESSLIRCVKCHAACGVAIGAAQAVRYGLGRDGHVYCTSCLAEREMDDMRCTGYGVLYETTAPDGAVVLEDCAGSLQFDVVRVLRRWTSRGFYGARVENVALRFIMPDGCIWSGRGRGDNMIVRCRRTRLRSLDD